MKANPPSHPLLPLSQEALQGCTAEKRSQKCPFCAPWMLLSLQIFAEGKKKCWERFEGLPLEGPLHSSEGPPHLQEGPTEHCCSTAAVTGSEAEDMLGQERVNSSRHPNPAHFAFLFWVSGLRPDAKF